MESVLRDIWAKSCVQHVVVEMLSDILQGADNDKKTVE